MKTRLLGMAAAAIIATTGIAAGVAIAQGGGIDTGPTLFHSVQPCRVFDTRETGVGPFTGGVEGSFSVKDAGMIDVQGGNPDGCGIPAEASAVMLNVHALPGATGHVEVWPFASHEPHATTMLIERGVRTSNATSMPVCAAAEDVICTNDLSIKVVYRNPGDNPKGTTLVGDVVGYFAPESVEEPPPAE